MIISAILAVSKNGVIGIDNQLPWRLSDDLKFFKKTTLNSYIIMGRKSYESIGRPLPKRTNIIISRNLDYKADGCIVVHSIQEAINLAQQNNQKEIFIIGGATIYEQSIDWIDRFYISNVDCEIQNGTAFFSMSLLENWKKMSSEKYTKNVKNDFDFEVNIYER